MSSAPAAVARSAKDALRAQLWPLPTVAIVVAVTLGLVLPRVDAAVDDRLPGAVTAVVFGGDGNAASTVLDAVASSLITVTSLTFSLTVVTLQLASSQFSPRLLRTFTQDLFVQGTLALFLSTFAFSLTVLRSVRSGGDGQDPFVPRLAVTTAFVLAILSVIGLVLFLAHLTRQIRVETMLHEVARDAAGTVRSVLAPRGEGNPATAVAPGRGQPLLSTSSGFLLRVDTDELLKASRQAGAVLEITALPGDFIVQGAPLGSAHGRQGPLSADQLTELAETVGGSLRTGPERTAAQDVGFGLRQLTDVANKALSPGINDPTTAIHAIDHISVVLSQLAGCELGPVEHTADEGARVVVNRPDLEHLVEMSLTQIRRYGAGDPLVMGRLYLLLDELAWNVPATDLGLVDRERRRLDATTASADFDDVSRARLAAISARVGTMASPTRDPVDPGIIDGAH
ncbi:hypothetical protein BA895_07835 [Humibacillus sp. DSM 29435]|uniref:DUF2254 domain-containing protein n=1 Tax=Humibacillus sp. DSM 29435 TaxID=1869167 RepID=UPI000871D06D|nr:DUF2254 domain-containing protein [Humibacillus sp. DSM 29435]OFE15034.1 hypothetical protein BA895_07835 [Humibacillus sp. DSM 29435]